MSPLDDTLVVIRHGGTEAVNVRCSRFLFLMVCLLVMQTPMSHAAGLQNIRIVAVEENGFSNDVANQLLSLLNNSATVFKVERISSTAVKPIDADALLVVVGESAAKELMSIDTGRTPILLVAPQRVTAEWDAEKGVSSATTLAAIQFEQPLPRMLNLSALVETTMRRDQAKIVGVLASPLLLKRVVALETLANERKLRLRTEVVDSEMAVGPAVARLVEQSNLILALPDPLVHTANTVQPILLLSYRSGVPVIAYSAAYLRAGATVALYSTPEQIARQAAETINAMRSGKPVPALQEPRYFTVGTNTAVARSLSLDIPSPAVLEERLRSMKE